MRLNSLRATTRRRQPPALAPVPALVLAAVLALTLAGALAAESGSYWQAGTGVRVGGVYFHVVSVAPDTEALFRVTERLEAAGLEEHPDCYRVSRTYYHRESCPVVQEHFRRHADAADSAAPERAPASRAGGSHPIHYVQGNYQPRQAPYWGSTGFWHAPWLSQGYWFSRPGLGFGPGFRPALRPPYRSGFYGHGRGGGYAGGASFRFW